MADDNYNRTLESLQQYIPFLDNMISQLKDPSKKNREQQLNKMQSLHAMITDKRKKLKLETLIKCEDVISKLYEKVHNKPISVKKGSENVSSTPASPSPPREIISLTPLTIPTERLEENRIPRIDIYSSAGESLSRLRQQENIYLGTKVPDMSKPPISLEDLKTLEDDVQEKINETSLNQASLYELNNLREKLTEQIHMEEVLLLSPQKNKGDDLEFINTTVRNNLSLTKKVMQPPDKPKGKESSRSSPSKRVESSPSTSSSKKEHKTVASSVSKSPKILKEPASIFGSILSHIDDQIIEGKKKKEERRNSLTGKDEKKREDRDVKRKDRKHSVSSESSDEKKDGKDVKEKEKDTSSKEDKHKSQEEKKSKGSKESETKQKERRTSADKDKLKDAKETNSKEDKLKHSSTEIPKDALFSLTGKKTFEFEEERLKKDLQRDDKSNESNDTSTGSEVAGNKDTLGKISPKKDTIGKISVKKDLGVKLNVVDDKEEVTKPTMFKRLADKYNPKPRKPTIELDVDKEVVEIIEEKMKTSPPKLPLINQLTAPVPPPASLLLCSQMEPEMPEPVQILPTVIQSILTPGTTELINNVVSQLRQNNGETDAKNIPLLPSPSVENFISEYMREDNFVSEYSKDNFTTDDFPHNNLQINDFNNFQGSQLRRDRLNFEPPTPPIINNQFNQVNNQNPRFMSPISGDGFNESFPPNRSYTPMPQAFPQPYTNFPSNQNNQSTPVDIQPLDYYPPNAPVPSNQYNCGPPLLSPEVPHFHNEQKTGNFGMMPNHDHFGHNEDMRWRQDDRFHWDRRDQDHRMNRDPRTYREYREMRESRDPRVINRDPRDNRAMRDPRVNRDLRENRDLRDSRDPRERDPRINRDRDMEHDRSRYGDNRSQARGGRLGRYDSKFDRMYSRTNRDRSRSRSRSYAKETFISPLDSLYNEKEKHKTGKGYGVQNFRIPKIKKEDEDQSTKVSSTNEDVCEPAQSVVNDDTIDSTHNEVADIGKTVNIEQIEEVSKNVVEEQENEKCVSEKEPEVEQDDQEPPKLDNEMEETKEAQAPILMPAIQSVEQDQAKPADQTILAQFFTNLLGSQNKRDKKTALYSLISTFSDTFSEKELSKITKIIKADDEAESSEEEEDVKKPEHVPAVETTKEPEKEADVEEPHPDDSPTKTKRKYKRRFRRISSTASLKDDEKNEEESKEQHKEENVEIAKIPDTMETSIAEEENVVVSVGERIKSRKRISASLPKPKKKCKTELDMLHEDIQEMFIRDGVLTASGKRMCRILKTDPSALTTPQTTSAAEPQKIRKKPGPKPKPKIHLSDIKTVKHIRVLLSKIPDSNFEQKEESPTRRNLRSSIKQSYAESDDDDDDNSAPPDDRSALEGEESDVESSDTEKDKSPQTTDNKTKAIKRKRGKGWASGNIPSNKKKKKKQLLAEESAASTDINDATSPSDSDKSFVEPDKNYYIDFVTHKSHECKLCDYKGRFITTHYKTQHPESEVLTSRFSPAVAQEAVEDSKKNLTKYEEILRIQGSGKFHFTCRFCAFNTTVPPTIFYDHITTHTGEYRHICPMCDFSAPSGKTLKSHMSNIHNNADKRVARKSYSQTILFAYMCGECNYVQLNQKNVEDHINIFHLQKPKIYKVNMSTTLDPEFVKLVQTESKKDSAAIAEQDTSDDEQPLVPKEKKNKVEKAMPPPQAKRRNKPGPKSVKERLKAKRERALMDKDENSSDTSSIAESETSNSTEMEQVITPAQSPVKPPPANKRRLARDMSALEDNILGDRSRRAAKDKAAEKLKTLMEFADSGQKRKSPSTPVDDDKNKKENTESKINKEQATATPESQKSSVVEEQPKVKKEIDLNVFTCKTDIQEENKKIEQERLQLMDEVNKSMGSRTSLNFVDKLCNRLSNNDVMVKQEPRDDFTESPFPDTHNIALTMPVLEKNSPIHGASAATKAASIPKHTKKPVLEAADIHVSNSNYDVTQKNDKLITDMIQKLKGKLANIPDDKSESSMTMEDMDYDSEGPPPLTHVNELPNVKPADGTTKSLLIGGMLKVIKYPNTLMFSCLVPPCVFSTDNKEAFQKHCSEGHKYQHSSTLCEICGIEIRSAVDGNGTLLEKIFQHAIQEHADFTSESKESFVKPTTSILRIRKLSGDALSVSKDWDEEIEKITIPSQNENEEINKQNETSFVSEVTVNETNTMEEPTPTMVELDLSDENPFPFKISGVMSLAEPPPPLMPINKTGPAITSQLIVKEAKLSASELVMQRKTAKAMNKFISSVGDLYKCPHYYCLFSTNFRDFLERHLKAHKLEPEAMIPCVYCDMKTPWEHVPMHIDIRHAHCRYACSYCLYRAVAKEYVFLHQDQIHPDCDYSVIALPQPKHAKRWAIADFKVDPRTLCEPYRCTAACGVEFLFENEFKRHLQDVHKSNFIACGYKNCTHRVQAIKMPSHWALRHCVSLYQCGHCKVNSPEIMKLYQHYAYFHQGLVPDILIRKNAKIQDGVTLGYTQEAFNVLRKIVTIPSNIVGENKLEQPPEPKTVPVIYPKKQNYAVPTPTKIANRQVVTTLPSNVSKGVLIPFNKSIITTAINIASATCPSSSASNILFLPSVPSAGTSSTSSGMVVSPQAIVQSTVVAPVGKTSEVPAIPTVVTAIPTLQELISVQTDNSQDNQDTIMETDVLDTDLSIAPLEHITLSEENNQNSEEADTCEADPLSLDADMDLNDPSKLAGDSSGDESDGTKTDKSKTDEKNGLMSYQLYRCAFCDISFSNSVDFKRHATYSLTCRKEEPVTKPFLCVHCRKQLKNPHALVEHIQCHGVLRFTCSLCGCKFPTITQTRCHIKNRHSITQTLMTPLNPIKKNIDTDEYMVRPKLITIKNSTGKDVSLADAPDPASMTENIYTPETADQIPMRHILSCSVKCGLCPYTTKVRTNMVRHLQFHSEEKAVPDTAPVNPVPCLEKNEKMFDKMVNLASSSHTNSRMGGAKPDSKDKEGDNCPEFVPSHCRYVCCAHGCSYICPEEGNLRHHLIALHNSDASFTCVHCKMDLTPTDADNLMKHFKLHGLQLYRCQYCPFMHNLKHKVEKHVSDAHLDVPVKVVTVRCMEAEPKDSSQEPSNSNSQTAAPPATSGKINKPWRCCMCKFKSGTEKGIQTHVLEKHEFDSQFKCALCSYKTNDVDTLTDHFKVTHDNQTIDIIYAYRKVEDDKEKETETFDTTPLWQRDRPRVRHIRGILFDESTPTVTKSPKKMKIVATTPPPGPSGVQIVGLSTRPSAVASPAPAAKSTTPPPGPSGVKPQTSSSATAGIKTLPPSAAPKNSNLDLAIESVVNGTADILRKPDGVSDDFFQTVNKLMKDSNDDIAKLKDSMVIVIDDEDEPKTPVAKNKDNKNSPVAKNRHLKRKGIEVAGVSKVLKISDEIIDLESNESDSEVDELSERSLKVRFGGFGAPLWRQFKCPVCNMFKSKRISDFIFHLYKEMKLFRFQCKVCQDESITYRYMHKHVRDHQMGDNCEEHISALPPHEKLLTWLQMVIREQSKTITHNYPKSPPVAVGGSNLVDCNFCKDKFKSEQERNEHTVIHWINKPYRCPSCTFDAYMRRDVEKHFKAVHAKNAPETTESDAVIETGPTVDKLLSISDEQHMREVRELTSESTEIQGSVEDILPEETEERAQDPLDVPVSLICDEEVEMKADEAVLSDSDLIIVTKTDNNVPTDTEAFCCEYCAFMTSSEMQVISHISAIHEHMPISFKRLDRVACNNPKEHVGCSLCSEIGSEIRIRQHFMENHTGRNFNIYRYQCLLCPQQKRFLKYQGLRVHFNRMHTGSQVQYTSLYDKNFDASGLKTYKCPQCPYVRNLRSNTLNNMRQHLKQHFKAFKCGICTPSLKYKTRAEVLTHCNKEHGGRGELQIIQDNHQLEQYNLTMAEIIASAVEVPVERTVKTTARKSTSAPHACDEAAEYSFYGTQPEEVDLSKIMTSVEINGMNLDMSAEKLAKIFDLNVSVALEDCNLAVNLSSVFDS